ncbi:peroxidase family protein [Aquipuribacter sp. MA13-6]|uniref:peroxidase family protein n=1 Tax=unclassified Aquipuribacter TaxID=2635084 RepID=UPI003EEDADC9
MVLTGLGLLTISPPATADHEPGHTGPSFQLIRSDLEFILRQIEIAEAHAAGGELLGDGENQVGSPLLGFGLRTVTGEDNNLFAGPATADAKRYRDFGAADQVFPRLLSPQFRDADVIPPSAAVGPGQAVGDTTSYTQKVARQFVYDAEPRRISNLVVDQTEDNPAAVAASTRLNGEPVLVDHDDDPATPAIVEFPATAPDLGLSAPFNSWFTFFGQFFDHGLDLVSKGGNGTVVVPLDPDDPLYDPTSTSNFMVVTRATNQPGPDGVVGTVDDVQEHMNTTTPFVDQNQTYTSHPSHQVFLREYAVGPNGPVSTGRLLEGPDGGLASWADVKAQAANVLGIELVDADVSSVPLLLTDPYGRFVPGGNGLPQLVVPPGGPTDLVGGDLADPATVDEAYSTGHAFLDDIAHHAVPGAVNGVAQVPDDDPGTTDDGDPSTYDDEMLEEHFITGDGRGNENIALTSVHHVFHSEHNRVWQQVQDVIVAEADPGFTAQWQLDGGAWDGERLFQAARLVTEMQYQHLVFEEFGRTVSPNIDVVPANESGYIPSIDPAISAEFAHVVYRFGHSMLTEDVARIGEDGSDMSLGLLEAFLDPTVYDDNGAMSPEEAAGTLVRGAVELQGNEIDEFVTPTLRNSLLGLPLDLPAINMTRARDAGVPGLNEARRTFFAESGDSTVRPYSSWNDFRSALRNPESAVNFVAAYGTHPTITSAMTIDTRRAAAALLVQGGAGAPGDRVAFMNSSGTFARVDGRTTSGVDDVDFWAGGLAERPRVFGAMLGSSFNYVFEQQMEDLQNGDRFYYLSRLIGTNLLGQLEANSFAGIIERNTTAENLPANVFATPDCTIEVGLLQSDGQGSYVDNASMAPCTGDQLADDADGNLRFTGGEHIRFIGTGAADRMWSDEGDDHILGLGGDDVIEGGDGNDSIVGGDGDDIITDLNGDDNLKGGNGNDAIHAGPGLDLILAGAGQDFVMHGADETESFGNTGDDFIMGGNAHDIIAGNAGDDWIEGGGGTDLLQGDERNGFQNDPDGGDDVLIANVGNDDYDAEGGDDIMVAGTGTNRNEGMMGFDWVTNVRHQFPANDDMRLTGLLPPDVNNVRDRFDLVEGLSGWNHDDTLRGDDRDSETPDPGQQPGERAFENHELRNPALIDGLQALLPDQAPDENGVWFTGGNILLGGAGGDIVEGRGGDDVIDGDSWLNVMLEAPSSSGAGTTRYSSMSQLQARVFSGELSPADIRIVREIVTEDDGSIDEAQYSGAPEEYDISIGTSGGRSLVTISHTGGAQTDGTDHVWGVEQFRFGVGDTSVVLPVADLPTNVAATGTVVISDVSPTEDAELTATVEDLVDPDGVPDLLTFSWQALIGEDWITVATGETFAPGDLTVGAPLRVLLSFADLEGNPEQLVSEETLPVANVNDIPTGGPVITPDAPEVGDQLIALTDGIEDADGIPADAVHTFQWLAADPTDPGDFDPVAGATASTHTPTAADVGSAFVVVVGYTDSHGTAEQVQSAATQPLAAGDVPVAEASAAALTFPTLAITASSTLDVVLSNTGTAPLNVSGLAFTGRDAGAFSTTSSCAVVAAGSSCTVTVRFSPVVIGENRGTLEIAHDAVGSPTLVALTGTGTAAPVAAALNAPGAVDFGTRRLGTVRTQNVRLRNLGTVPIAVSSITTSAPFSVPAGACGGVIPARGRCEVAVTFAPTAAGAVARALTVTTNATNPVVTVQLSGSGR